jgi:predicted nucleic acid-binding protein
MSEPILFDTSVWIDFIQKRDNPQSSLLKEYLLQNNPICLCPPIIQEILQGCKLEEQFEKMKFSLHQLTLLECQHYFANVGAATLYFKLRKSGITVRKPNDCLIAWYAINNKIKLCHNDSDFELIAKATELEIIKF